MFLTKSGDLGMVLRLGGVDYECLDAAQREAVTKRFEVALRLWDEHTRLSQYVLKRNRLAWPEESTPASGRRRPPAPAASLPDRARRPTSTPSTLYLVVLTEATRSPEHVAHAHAAGRGGRRRTRCGSGCRRLTTVLRLDARSPSAVPAAATQGRRLRPAARGHHASPGAVERGGVHVLPPPPELRARQSRTRVRLRDDTFLDYDLCDSALECHRTHLRLDDTYVRVITLKEPPTQTFPHLFQALYEIPSNLILMNDWQRESQAAVRREIHAKRRHFHNAKVSLSNYVTDTPPGARRSARRRQRRGARQGPRRVPDRTDAPGALLRAVHDDASSCTTTTPRRWSAASPRASRPLPPTTRR